MIISEYHAYKTIWTLFIVDLNSLPAVSSVLSILNFVHVIGLHLDKFKHMLLSVALSSYQEWFLNKGLGF